MPIEIIPGYVRDDQVILDICAGNEPEWLVESACKAAMARSDRATAEENARLILIALGRLARAGTLETIAVLRELLAEFVPLEDELVVMVRELTEEIRYLLREAGPEWEAGTIDMAGVCTQRDDCESVYHLVLLQGAIGSEGAKLLHQLDQEVIAHFSVPRPQFSWGKYGGPTELDLHTRRNDPDAWWVQGD